MGRLQLFHVLACRVCHKALRADAVERDLEQRVGAHGQDRQDHAPAKCLVLPHLPGREADLRGRLRLRVDGIVLLRLRARGDLRKVIILVAVDADASKRAVLQRISMMLLVSVKKLSKKRWGIYIKNVWLF